MANISESCKWQWFQGGQVGFPRLKPSPWWRRPSFQQALPHAMAVLAVLVAFSVLLAFYQVVNNAVQHGEFLRQAMAEQVRAKWQCNTLPAYGARESCLQLLTTPAPAKSAALNL
jgi:hypothetical protein